MTTRQEFFEAEALQAALVAAVERVGGKTDVDELLDGVPVELVDLANDILVRLYGTMPESVIDIEDGVQAPATLHGFGMRFRAELDRDGKPSRMKFFRVQESASSIAINLVGLVIAIGIWSPAGAVPVINVAKTIYDNLVTLQGKHDEAAMLCYQALLRWQLEHRGAGAPTVGDFLVLTAHGVEAPLTTEVAIKAQRRLEGLRLVKVTAWGGDGGDLDHPDNRWQATT